MKITIRHLMAINAATELALRGRDEIIRRNDETSVASVPFKLHSDTLFDLATNSSRIGKELEAYEVTRRKAMKDAQVEGKPPAKGSAEEASLVEAINAMLDREVDIKLIRFKLTDFKLDDNPGLAPAIAPMMRIINASDRKREEI